MPVVRVSHVISEQNIYPGLSRPHFVVVVHDHPVAVRGCRSLSETRDTHAHGEWWHEGVAPPHSGHILGSEKACLPVVLEVGG